MSKSILRGSAAFAAAVLCSACLAVVAAEGKGKSDVALAAGEQAPKDHLRAQVFLPVDRLPAGGTCRFAVVLDVENGWHINANPASFEFVKATDIVVKAKHGTKAAKVEYPKGRDLRVEGYDGPLRVYEGHVVVFGTLSIPAEAARQTEEITVEVRFQACNDQQCVAPKTAKLIGKVPVAAPGEQVKAMNEELFKTDKKKDERRTT